MMKQYGPYKVGQVLPKGALITDSGQLAVVGLFHKNTSHVVKDTKTQAINAEGIVVSDTLVPVTIRQEVTTL